MNIYPAIDMVNGRAVRLKQGRADDMTVYGDPVDMARRFCDEGAEYLHMVDLDGAFTGADGNKAIALKIAKSVPLKIQLGGGIRDMDTIDSLLSGGIERVILGTAAVRDPALARAALKKYGGEHIVIGIDARDSRVAVQGWVEGSDVTPVDLAQGMKAAGAKYIVYTDIARRYAVRPQCGLHARIGRKERHVHNRVGRREQRKRYTARARRGLRGRNNRQGNL